MIEKERIQIIQDQLKTFAEERDWDKFHSPKNLSMALAKEAAELLEEFQWLTEEESSKIDPVKYGRVKDEIGDVLICLVQLASKLNIDIIESAECKIIKNAEKYPVEKSKGNARKYSEL